MGGEAVIEIVQRIFGAKPKTKSEMEHKFPLTSEIESYAQKKMTTLRSLLSNLNKSGRGLDTTTKISSLKELEELRIKGIISQAEFEALKSDILKT